MIVVTSFRSPGPAVSRGLSLVLLLLVILAGCGSEEESPAGAADQAGDHPEPGGTAVVALASDPQVLNSLIRTSTAAGQILAELQDGLAELDEDLVWQPRIARSWQIAPDGLSVTYYLRPWVWSDGESLTVHDVAATFDLIRDARVASPVRGFYEDVARAVVVDSATIRYELVRRLPDPLTRTIHPILPVHRLADLDPAEIRSWPLNRQPLSSGDFVPESWEHNRTLNLVANSRYPGAAPLLERVVFRILPEESSRVVALETGEVDLVDGLVPSTARRLARSGTIKIVTTGGRQFYYVMWNCRNPIFADAGTRRALSLALDRQMLIDSVLSGYAVPASGPIPPALWNHHQGLPSAAYDPARARRELAVAGWRDQDGDGILERAGLALAFTLLTRQGDSVREAGAVILQQNLQAVGASVTLLVLEHATGLSRIRSADFDSYFGLFNANLFGDPSGLVRSDAIDRYNFGGYANAKVDSLLDLALESADRSRMLPLWFAVQEELATDPPAAYLCYPERLVGVGPRLRNVRPHLLSPLNNLSQWWIPVAQRRYKSTPDD